jgi:hypothetical protein
MDGLMTQQDRDLRPTLDGIIQVFKSDELTHTELVSSYEAIYVVTPEGVFCWEPAMLGGRGAWAKLNKAAYGVQEEA